MNPKNSIVLLLALCITTAQPISLPALKLPAPVIVVAKVACTAAPIFIFAHQAPRIINALHAGPLGAIAITVIGSFYVGNVISGGIGSALNRK
jgi:hypothetical protein